MLKTQQSRLIWPENFHVFLRKVLIITMFHATTILMQSLSPNIKTRGNKYTTQQSVCFNPPATYMTKICKSLFSLSFATKHQNPLKESKFKIQSTINLYHQRNIESMLPIMSFKLSKITSSVAFSSLTPIS